MEFEEEGIGESTRYTLKYIAASPVERLYTFTVSGEVLEELGEVLSRYRKHYMEGTYKSLEILESCT